MVQLFLTVGVKSFEEIVLDIYFTNKKLQKLCNNQAQLIRKHGLKPAKKISRHLHNMRVAQSLEDIRYLPGRCHPLSGDRAGQFALDLVHPHRLIFVPHHDPIPQKEDGGVDWQSITAVRIIAVEDYH